MAEKTAEEIEQERIEKDAADKKKKKVQFDAEQTVVVNGLYNQAFGEGAAKAQADYEKRLADERAAFEKRLADEKAAYEKQIEDAKAAIGKKTEEPPPPPKLEEINIDEHPAVKQLKARMEELSTIFGTVKQERDTFKAETEKAKLERRKSRKKDQFLGALKDANVTFFDPLEAYELAEKEGLEYDDDSDRVIVRNAATGVAKLNENGEPMNAVDFVKDFASRKKYLVKAATQEGGTGSGASDKIPNDKGTPKDWSKATDEEFEALRQATLAKQR